MFSKIHSWPTLRRSESGSDASQSSRSRFHSVSLPVMDTADVHITRKPAPFVIRWIYGCNWRAGVVNLKLTAPWETRVLYAAGSCAVLYDWTKHQQRILEGHRHTVTNIAANGDGKILVTADSGPEDAVIVWDARDLLPLRTIFSPHGASRLHKMAVSADAKYILTVACQDQATVHWWIWSNGLDTPEASHSFAVGRGGIVDMGFDPGRSEQFVVLARYQLWIGLAAKKINKELGETRETDDYELKMRPIGGSMPEWGRFSCYTFVENSSRVLVATTRGRVLVYSGGNGDQVMDYDRLKNVKTLHIEDRAIHVIKSIDGIIATANSGGEVKFYDEDMRLVYVMRDRLGAVRWISFDLFPRNIKIFNPKCKKICPCWEKVATSSDSTGAPCDKLLRHNLPHDYCVEPKPFVARNFFVCTRDEGIKYVEFLTGKVLTVVDCRGAAAAAVTVHPEIPLLCVGTVDGAVELYDGGRRRLARRLDLRDSLGAEKHDDRRLAVTTIEYSPEGLHLACGLNSGKLLFLHPTFLSIKEEKDHTRYPITHIRYSGDAKLLATADKGRYVCVYKYDDGWRYIDKRQAHYKPITSLFFTPSGLVSLGLDRMMVVYEVGDGVKVVSSNRVEQSALPLTGIPWPTPPGLDEETFHVDLRLVLVANDQFKYKIVNSSTGTCLSTVLGPRFSHPARRLYLVSRTADDEQQQYLVFITKDVVGLQKMPLDGNPWKHVAMLGHPLQVVDSCYHERSGALFTIGAKDCCVTQWETVFKSVETTTKRGGCGLEPYYCLLDGGRPGWLFQEIRDLFYYVQVVCQGTFTPVARRVRDHIPVDALPDLMRTLGFFLTEYEAENLITEAKYDVYRRQPSYEVDFEQFVMLYLNHRPALGDNYKQVRAAFRLFAELRAAPALPRDAFIAVLAQNGECFSRELSWYLLSVLCEMCPETRSNMVEEDFSFMPENISLKDFLTSILGVQEVECSDQSVKESIYSAATSSTATGSTVPYY
ncbi:cilia- and flagella-associated protein 251-like [Aricia agestis]|uniref:cilia- and flagella-associated protein 251-like n=1 Tax=Aricia agestis TaxID=91739 RepID=UPI001C20B29C|nr:cilia- and flagella-associated protein 251-like [Aricia agestis]